MAFGFGFNKQKTLSAAEKYVQQGKLSNAIAEYERVTKADPKDLTVTNTIGDLYSRLGDADKATDCFKTVGDAYAAQGFTVKAIAMYKKIGKLKPSLESVLKLAELYTQQGLFNDARAQYLQVAEEFMKSGELENAVRIFQKILEMDPENSSMRIKLAEVYVRLGKKTEAWKIFSAAAETLRSKGNLPGAEEVLQRMLTLDPGNGYALLLQGRNLLAAGDAEAAIASLQKVPDLDSNGEGLRDLFDAYLKTGRLSDAGTLAGKLLAVHNDLASISCFADALLQAGQYENALLVYDQHADRLLAENSEKVVKSLHAIIGHVRDNPTSLEKLLELFEKAGETTHVNEVIELLAHASVQAGDLPRARDLYRKLAAAEPGNSLHLNHYRQVVSQLGGPAADSLISADEAAVIVDELEATSPTVHPHYSDSVALAVRAALTDAELFISYNMPAKALGPLTTALPLAPADLRLNQRLAALHTRAGRFAEAGVCCRTIQTVLSDAGHPEEATRYGELAERYEMRAQAHDSASEEGGLEVAGAEGRRPAAAPWPSTPRGAGDELEFSVVASQDVDEEDPAEIAMATSSAHSKISAEPEEIDLSSEWDDTISIEGDELPAVAEASADEVSDRQPAMENFGIAKPIGSKSRARTADPEKSEETVEEIRFYLEHGMPEQAAAAIEKLEAVTDDPALLNELRAELEAAANGAPAPGFSDDAGAEFAIDTPLEELSVSDIPAATDQELGSGAELAVEPAAEAVPAEVEFAEAEFAVEEFSEPPVIADASPFPPAAQSKPAALDEFVSDLEPSLDQGVLQADAQNVRAAVEAARQAAPAAASEPIPISALLEPVGEAAPTVFGSGPSGIMGEVVADIEASLGEDFLRDAPAPAVAALPSIPTWPAVQAAPLAASAAAAAAGSAMARSAPAPQSLAAAPVVAPVSAIPPLQPTAVKASPFAEDVGVDLSEMFGELKQDLEAGGDRNDEDPETHYNLGIAFREMGLLDEAIGELQKTCQTVDRGHPFPLLMQTYTWLAQCFIEKGVPEAAIRWYDKAMQFKGIDEETRIALYYEIAAAYESCGDRTAALKNFMEVYGRNIDYRDVAERIRALKS